MSDEYYIKRYLILEHIVEGIVHIMLRLDAGILDKPMYPRGPLRFRCQEVPKGLGP